MALIPSNLLLRAYALLMLIISYLLVSTPSTPLSSPLIAVLGASMHIHPAHFQPSINPLTRKPIPLDPETSELLGALALVIATLAITQFTLASGLTTPPGLTSTRTSSSSAGGAGNKRRRGEELHTLLSSQSTHLTLSFIHIVCSGVLVAWIYVFHSQRNLFSGLSDSSDISAPGSLGSVLGNQVVFSVGLIDMLFHGYVWTLIREERREVLVAVQNARGVGGEDEHDE